MNLTNYTLFSCIAGLTALLVLTDAVAEDTPLVTNANQQIFLDKILQRNLEVERGDSDTNTIRTTEKIVRISEADYTLIGRYRAASDGSMRIDVFADGQRVFSEGTDEAGVWEWHGGQKVPVDVDHGGAAAGALQHGIEFNLFSLAELRARGHTIELVDRKIVRGSRYFVLKVTLNDGFETFRYVNEETWLVELSRDYRALHPGVDPGKKSIETRHDQWARTDGILYATRSRDYDGSSDQPTQTGVVLHSRYNVPSSELDFERAYVPDGAPDYE